jgi:hypothetical protein
MTTCAVYVHTASAFVLPIASSGSACMSCRLFLDKDCVMYVSHIRCADRTHASLDLGFLQYRCKCKLVWSCVGSSLCLNQLACTTTDVQFCHCFNAEPDCTHQKRLCLLQRPSKPNERSWTARLSLVIHVYTPDDPWLKKN